MVSEESLAFVDLMRKDDMDRRASAVREQTNPNERGEQSQESVTEEANNRPSSDSGDDADPSTSVFEESQEVITSPAVPVSEVALGTDPLQATISDNSPAEQVDAFQESEKPTEASTALQESASQAELAEVFQESSSPAEPPEVFQESGRPTEATAASQELGSEAEASGAPQESVAAAEAATALQDAGNAAELADVFQETEQAPQTSISQNEPLEAVSASPHQVFTENGQQAATNEQIRQEGAQVTEIPNLSGDTTIIAPEGMPEFDQMLKRFDSDYRPPSKPIGDDLEFPEIDDQPPSEELQSTSEFAESMMAGFTESLEQFERRGA